MLAGKPNAEMFPFEAVHFATRAPDDLSRKMTLSVSSDHLAQGLQYAGIGGIPPFLDWLTKMQEHEHQRNCAEEGWTLTATSGSQDALYKVCDLVTLLSSIEHT